MLFDPHIHMSARTTDDYQAMAAAGIRAIVEPDWKYAVYYDPFTGSPTEYEMYDLANDPLEMKNLAHAKNSTPESVVERARLHRRLSAVMHEHGTAPDEEGHLRLRYDPLIGAPFRNGLTDVDLWPVWDAVQCPVMVLRGADSDLLLPETARERGVDVERLAAELRDQRGLLRLPRVLWRLRVLAGAARELVTPHAPLLPFLSLTFLTWSAIAAGAALVEVAIAIVLLVGLVL